MSGVAGLALLVIALSSLLASFTDWLFMDVLVHRQYQAAPEIWRPSGGVQRIVLSQIVGALASTAVVILCLMLPGRPLLIAGSVWLAGPLPVMLQNVQWMKFRPAIGASHAAGWLARLLITALLATVLITGWRPTP